MNKFQYLQKLIRESWIDVAVDLPQQGDYNDYLVMDDEGNLAVGNYRHDAKAWDSCNFGWLECRQRDPDRPVGIYDVKYWLPLPLDETIMPTYNGGIELA